MKRRPGAVALALVHCGRMSTVLAVPRLSSQCSFKQDLQTFPYLQHEQSRINFEGTSRGGTVGQLSQLL
jgi:hypothetical protein